MFKDVRGTSPPDLKRSLFRHGLSVRWRSLPEAAPVLACKLLFTAGPIQVSDFRANRFSGPRPMPDGPPGWRISRAAHAGFPPVGSSRRFTGVVRFEAASGESGAGLLWDATAADGRFSPAERANFFKAGGYDTHSIGNARMHRNARR